MSEMDAGYPQNHQLSAIGTHSLKNNEIVDEPLCPKKLKNYENVGFIKKKKQIAIPRWQGSRNRNYNEIFYGPLYNLSNTELAVLKKYIQRKIV